MNSSIFYTPITKVALFNNKRNNEPRARVRMILSPPSPYLVTQTLRHAGVQHTTITLFSHTNSVYVYLPGLAERATCRYEYTSTTRGLLYVVCWPCWRPVVELSDHELDLGLSTRTPTSLNDGLSVASKPFRQHCHHLPVIHLCRLNSVH